jgi:glycosyltransferase involved in cell wall biosynthesis
MRLSLFTPTHNDQFLFEAYNSLKLQTLEDWEWVIVPNGKLKTIDERISKDKRVKIVKGGEELTNVGALKRLACDASTGDAFIEFDHDDLLVPGDTLHQIQKRFQEGAGFVYSDNIVFKFKSGIENKPEEVTKFESVAWAKQHGWETYSTKIYGREMQVNKCFEVTPRSLCEIYYCPDHVRAWSRKAYYEAGGHNKDLSVCDDQELMIKTYMTGAPFVHTGGCHYLYRMFESNTVVTRNKEIQTLCKQLREQHVQGLVKAWLKRKNYPELNLSELRKKGWNFDRDLLQGFGENQYGHIIAKDELQRFAGWQVREFMNEAYRALTPGGYLTITVPDSQSAISYADVEWQSRFSVASMMPYTQLKTANGNGKIRCRFQLINCLEDYPSDWHKENKYKYIRFELTALKGQRHPGLQHI